MKKFTFIIAAIGLISLASCKKDYTCECTLSGGGLSGTFSETIKDTKKKAKEKCDSGNYSETSGGVTTTATCTLK
ncbi:MAG TPA: hypothetical protein VL092_13015 [Chitinophagaceae bacterium]|nr:hypothetical protein [Chitinophagaceae bacterium]